MAKFDIVSIGDTTIDAFIEIHEASVHCNINHVDCQLCLSFGDKIPYEQLSLVPACGNSSNNAIGSSRLGMRDAFIGAVGDDHQGQQIIDELKREGVDTHMMTVNRGVPTNFHFVLVFRGERTILIKHQKYRYDLPAALDTQWIYFSSMAAGTEKFHHQFGKFLAQNSKIRLAFNPGTFQMRMGAAKLAEIYKHTELLFLNREEAQLVTGQTNRDIHKLAHGMHKLGAKVAIITDGRDGSYASDGTKIWYVDHFPAPRVEATGAGDAYGTGFTAAIFHGLTIPQAMVWGTVNGGNVALKVGSHAGLQTKKQIESWIKKHPKFKAKEYK
ncbi:MAG TPA: carbohydrate kinase family protein [Patescibacteria group bacterium]|nr:carbohydrate kinase family protein [Patescibacteria group bacterium]